MEESELVLLSFWTSSVTLWR